MITLPFLTAWFVMVMLGIIGHEFDIPQMFVGYWAIFAVCALVLILLKTIGYVLGRVR